MSKSSKFEFVDEAISTIPIDSIQMDDRYRKDFGDIEDLAMDIKINGLINLPVITPKYQLIAGERRIQAMKFLGYTEVEVKFMDIRDEEHRLDLEIAENVMRKDFSKIERLEFAERLERIESIKAKERQAINGSNNLGLNVQNFAPLDETSKGTTRDLVAEKIGIGSGETYRKEKFIAENAEPELLAQWDEGDISTNKAYLKIKEELDKAKKELKSKEDELLILNNNIGILAEENEAYQVRIKIGQLAKSEFDNVDREKWIEFIHTAEPVVEKLLTALTLSGENLKFGGFVSEKLKKITTAFKPLINYLDSITEEN